MINDKAKVGKNCSIHINTGIVATNGSNNAPVIGNDVIIGFGAVIVGDVCISNNVVVGANSVVTKSIAEENVTVAGVPAKKIKSKGSKEWQRS